MSCNQKMMRIWSLLSLVFLLSSYSIPLLASPTAKQLCRPDQRDALLGLKSEFSFDSDARPYEKTAEMWRNNTDCCSWDGVSCDPKTGMVVELSIGENFAGWSFTFNSSLFRLHHLQSLNLYTNKFAGILPDSIGSLKYLRVLNLEFCNFFGKIPSSLGNLSYLTDLNLAYNSFTEIPDSIGKLNRLKDLSLEGNEFSGSFPKGLLNLSSLTRMVLGSNRFKGTLPSNMSSLSKLEYFDISDNSFSGSVPPSLFMIPSLSVLYLRYNHFSGSLEMGNISSPSKFEVLALGRNNFNGSIPRIILKQVGLCVLDLAYLNTRNIVDLALFSQLVSLIILDISGLKLKIGSTLHLPSSVESLRLSSCNISEFPKFLQNQTRLYDLDISVNRIEGQVPKWLWSLPELRSVNISHNSFTGFEGPVDVIQRRLLFSLDISSNAFHDPFPLLPSSMKFLLGSDNRFSGEIPRTTCDLVDLRVLVLSDNNFNGSIPRCFENFNTSLSVLHLRNNSLSGIFPDESISSALGSLDVGHNQLSGRLPNSLANCSYLEFLNVEHNRINDTFPSWLQLLPFLRVLVFRFNEFNGPVSSSPGAELRIFDISENCFSGVLPSDYFTGWTALSSDVDNVGYTRYPSLGNYRKSVDLISKGLKMELLWSAFAIYKVVDVSGNRFEGGIPESIGLLKELIVLNMSNNAFAGRIPTSLANLSGLQSLDLSQNKLSGRIPPELGKLTFLARMNFSHNKLEGPIPQGTQIQSQDSSSFADNTGLCGVPLQETCGGKEEEATEEAEVEEKEEKEEAVSWIAAAIGYVPGVFCGVVIAHILASSYKFEWFIMKIFRCFT